MSSFTNFLNLFKWSPVSDAEEEFDVDKALNDNWDKIDTKLEEYIDEVDGRFQEFKEDVDAEIEEFERNSFATVEMTNGYIGDAYDPTQTYAVGDYCIYNNTLYRCNTAIATAEAWNSAHWTATSIASELENRLEFEIVDSW